jgi:hypothetical protein
VGVAEMMAHRDSWPEAATVTVAASAVTVGSIQGQG